jgi:hypothetical protein
MSEEIKEAPEQAEEQTEEQARAKMYEFLAEAFGPGAPNADKVAEWKQRFRRVRLLPMSDEEVYFVRPIKRNEYKALMKTAQASGSEDVETFLRERIVATCVLWPAMDAAQFDDGFAGTIDALYQIIMDASNFVSQEALFTVVREL